MEAKKYPYEFLVRWDDQGHISGAHIQYRIVVMDGDTKVHEGLGPACCVATEGESTGFPMKEIAAEINRSALETIEAMKAEMEQMRNEYSAAPPDRKR